MQLLPQLSMLPLLQGVPVILPDHTTATLNQDTGEVTDAAGGVLGNLNSTSLSNIFSKPSSSSTVPAQKTPAVTASTPDFSALQDWSKKNPFGYSGKTITESISDAKNTLLHPVDAAASLIFTSRLVFLIVGLLLIAAGLMQFRATQTVINTGTKASKLGAKLVA